MKLFTQNPVDEQIEFTMIENLLKNPYPECSRDIKKPGFDGRVF